MAEYQAPFCAICTDDAPSANLRQRPLGRGRALVAVCKDCDETHPREGGYAFGGTTRGSSARPPRITGRKNNG